MADKHTPTEQEILANVKHHYGWHGGVGDPPEDSVLLAAIRGTLDKTAGAEEGDVFDHPKFVGLWTYRAHGGTRQFCASVMIDGVVCETPMLDSWEGAIGAAKSLLDAPADEDQATSRTVNRDHLFGELVELARDLIANQTDTYCEWCESHAEKDSEGQVMAPVMHLIGCPAHTAVGLLAQVKDQSHG